ncbi:hypothetical protein CABS01_07670 [Colletotrichum abscissum]|uniref:uncharacterized protein n=1 Tax=Colletotrichum abscissum TaxID=1671311 RepID=UPI0027D724A4|nr:uncharacterized protein CABS01_07670 [Colletotrichum abscissum]KAK1509998.1 hypothetical protein CABS01_07670 [Colletotrichum abscissum]
MNQEPQTDTEHYSAIEVIVVVANVVIVKYIKRHTAYQHKSHSTQQRVSSLLGVLSETGKEIARAKQTPLSVVLSCLTAIRHADILFLSTNRNTLQLTKGTNDVFLAFPGPRLLPTRNTSISESTGTFLRHINVLDKPADPSAATVTDFTAQGLGPAFRPSADGNSVTSEKGALCILSGAQHEPLDEMTSRTYPVPFVAKSTLVEKGSISDVPQVESHVVAQAFDDDPTTFFTH